MSHTITFRFELSPRKARLMLATLALLAGPAELSSESVTLTTYYPAPSGVYTQMITTGNTWLARDAATAGVMVGATNALGAGDKMYVMGGEVGIGVTDPAARLHVGGTGGSTVELRVNGRIHTGDAGASGGVWLDSGQSMFVGQNGTNTGFWTSGAGWNAFQVTNAGNVGIGTTLPAAGRRLDVQGGNFAVSGDAAIGGKADVTSHIVSRVVCGPISYTANQGNICGGGAFVTNVSGLYARYYALGGDDASPSGNGTALCCSCPSGGCIW